jgi:hypothetical protein
VRGRDLLASTGGQIWLARTCLSSCRNPKRTSWRNVSIVPSTTRARRGSRRRPRAAIIGVGRQRSSHRAWRVTLS